MNEKLKLVAVFVFFLLFFTGFTLSRPKNILERQQTEFLGFQTINSDSVNYLQRLDLDKPFPLDNKTPVQYFLTKLALQFTNIYTVLWLFPFITFFGSLALLLLIFYQLKINPFIIVLGLSWNTTWIIHFFNYDRDNWMLLFFALFFYAIIQIHFFDKTKYWSLLILTVPLAMLSKTIGVYFLGTTLIFLAYKILEKNGLKLPNGLTIIPTLTIWGDYLFGLRNTQIISANSFSAFFVSPIHFLGVFSGLIYLRDNWLKIMLVTVVLTAHTLYNFGFGLPTIFKYIFFLSPLSLTCIALVFKGFGEKTGLISKKQLFFLMTVTLFFNLANLGRLIGNLA